MPTYDDAPALFHEWTHTDSLRRHAYAVEAAMGYYANHFGENEELWRMTGLHTGAVVIEESLVVIAGVSTS